MIPLKDNIPTRRPAYVTYALVVANVLVFIFFQQALFGPHGGFSSAGDPEKVVHYTFIPYRLSHPGDACGLHAIAADHNPVVSDSAPLCEGTVVQTTGGPEKIARVVDRSEPSVWVTIFTAMFMHGGVLHIAGNMLFLWIFGNNVEDAMGRLKFLAFYLVGGVIATLSQFALNANAAVPTLGASGAIAAVLGAYLLLYPKARVITVVFIFFFFTVITLPALLVLGLWFLFQLLDLGAQQGGGGGVAYLAHIGGFIFGLLTARLLASRYDPHYDLAPRPPVY